MAILSANALREILPDEGIREFPVVAADIIYRGAYVGMDPAGYVKPFEVGDMFIGIAYEEALNSGGDAGDVDCRVYVGGTFNLVLTSAALTDVGSPVFATNDNTLARTGHPDAWVGTVLHYEKSGYAVIKLRNPHDKWTQAIGGAQETVSNFAHEIVATGVAGAAAHYYSDEGFVYQSALGLGILMVTDAPQGIDFALDAVDEEASATLESGALLSVAKGITFEATLHMTDIGDAGGAALLNTDWGIGTALTTNSILSIDHADMVDLACFHMDGNAAAILFQSDDRTTDTGLVDTTIVNVTTAAATKNFKIIVRPAGTVEAWIDSARVLSSTAFLMLAAAEQLCGFVNVSKPSDNTTAALRMIRMRMAGGI
jgi:hypothetical protein